MHTMKSINNFPHSNAQLGGLLSSRNLHGQGSLTKEGFLKTALIPFLGIDVLGWCAEPNSPCEHQPPYSLSFSLSWANPALPAIWTIRKDFNLEPWNTNVPECSKRKKIWFGYLSFERQQWLQCAPGLYIFNLILLWCKMLNITIQVELKIVYHI